MPSSFSSAPKIQEPRDELIAEAKTAIAAEPSLFVSRGKLVQLVEDAKRVRLKPLNWSGLSALLSMSQPWRVFLELYDLPSPLWLPRHLLENETWPELRAIAGITDVPVLRPDGTLLTTPGYDDQTGIYYSPKLVLEPIPELPTEEDARSAIGNLSELLDAFPVVSKAHRSAMLAALATPFASLAIPGSSPLFLLDQPGEGNVATTAANAIGLLVSGRTMARLEMPASDRRLRKQLARLDAPGEATILLEGAQKLSDPAPLETAIEGTRWIDGADEEERRQRLIWFAHGANATLSRATAEWTLPIRFFDTDDDFFGSTFAWPAGFKAWLLTNRARFVRSILILLRAYVCAGKPEQPSEPWSRFGSWRALIGGALIWAGLDDPMLARRSLASATEDDDWTSMRELIAGLFSALPKEGLTTQEILSRLNEGGPWKMVKHALTEIFGTEKLPARRVGNLFRAHRGRAVGGAFLHRIGTSGAGYARWTVEQIPKIPASVSRPKLEAIVEARTDRICDYPESESVTLEKAEERGSSTGDRLSPVRGAAAHRGEEGRGAIAALRRDPPLESDSVILDLPIAASDRRRAAGPAMEVRAG